ncbi:MAG TPA: type II toxin-antitoxin system PemK/MazF family toxin [Firmicutes bacterium]|nr:type II toxin-antitoxin system PemK/MazF family toxin [Bacillota bacterium]
MSFDGERVPLPGDIYLCSLEGAGHVLRGPHYVVVLSDEPFNHLSTVVVVPLSTGARPASFRPQLRFHGENTRALPEQVRAMDKRRLKEYQGNVATTSFFAELRHTLRLLLALDEDNAQ